MSKKKGYYQTGGSSKLHDRRVKALKPGKRRSSGGSVYYERRKNRSDMPGTLTGTKQKKIMSVTLKKYPKKPKASATTASMEKYLDRVADIDKENKKRIGLANEISKIGKKKSSGSATPKKAKKSSRRR